MKLKQVIAVLLVIAAVAGILIYRSLDKKVTVVTGIANDSIAGAVVTTDEGSIYIEHLGEWPDQLKGKKVRVTGILVTKKMIPDPISPSGAISQGAEGDQDVMEQATWAVY